MPRLKFLLKDSFVLAVIDGVSRGAIFLVLLLAARELGPQKFGELSAIIATTTALGSIDLGLAIWLLRELVIDPAGAPGYISDAVGTSFAIGAAVMAVAVVLSLTALDPGLGAIAIGASAYATSLSMGNVLYATDRSARRYGPLFFGSILEKGGLAALAVPAAITHQLWLFGGAYFAAAVIRIAFVSVIYRRLRPWHALIALRPHVAARTLRKSFPFGVNTILVATVSRLDLLTVTLVAGALAAGYFSLGDKLVALATALASVLSLASMPVLGKPDAGSDSVASFTLRLAACVVAAGFALVAAVDLVGWPLIEALFGHSYAEARTAVALMLFAIPLSYGTALLTPMAYLLKREKIMVEWMSIVSVIGLVAVLVGTAAFGAVGAAAGYVLRQLVMVVVSMVVVVRPAAQDSPGPQPRAVPDLP